MYRLIATLLLLASASQAWAQGAGAQVNFLTPIGLQNVTFSYLNADSNFRLGQTEIGRGDLNTTNALFSYAWRFSMFGRFAQLGLAGKYLTIDARGEIDPGIPGRPPFEARVIRHGFGDPSASLRVGLIGAPALTPKQWREYDKGFQMYAQVGVFAPLGDYDPSRFLNPGFNRWALEFSLPMVVPLDGLRRKTFLEFTPRAFVYGDNTEPFPKIDRLKQDPLYVMELQASRLVTAKFWFSVGFHYQNGGQSVVDGIPQNNGLDQWYGEVGVGYFVNRNIALAATWGKIFSPTNLAQGDAWRARLVYAF